MTENILILFLYFSFTAEDKEIVRRQMEIVESQLPEGYKTDKIFTKTIMKTLKGIGS